MTAEPKAEKSGHGGTRIGAGRKKGSRNKWGREVKDAVLAALHHGKGAKAFFIEMKNGNTKERVAFAMVCARLIPSELALGEDGGNVAVQIVRFSAAPPLENVTPAALPAKPAEITGP